MDENNVITVPTTYVPNEKGFGYQLFKAMLKYRHCIAQVSISFLKINKNIIIVQTLLKILKQFTYSTARFYHLEKLSAFFNMHARWFESVNIDGVLQSPRSCGTEETSFRAFVKFVYSFYENRHSVKNVYIHHH